MTLITASTAAENRGFSRKSLSKLVAGAIGAMALMAAPMAAQASAVGVDFTSNGSVGSNVNTWTLGYQFTANSNTSVIGLGTWNSGISGDMEVGLWDSAQNLLASAFVNAADAQHGTANWVFASIAAVALTSGSNYYVGSYGISDYAFDVGGFSTDSRISYVRDAWTRGLGFPNLTSGFVGPTTGFFGGNVLLADSAVPTPGALALVGIGLAGIAVSRRRRAAV